MLVTVDRSLEQRTDLAEVGVVHVVRYELPIPEQLSGFCVKRQDRIGVEIGAGPDLAVKIRRRIADGQVDDASLCIERQRRPEATAAMLQRFLALPSICAGFTGIGHQIELPNRLARLKLKGAYPVLRAEIGACRTDNDEVLINEWRHAEILASSRAGDGLAPQK